MRVRYAEHVTQWVEFEIPEEGLEHEELEEAARDTAFETVQESGWHGTTVHETFYTKAD